MKSKRKVSLRVPKSPTAKADPLIAHHLNALLHTVRCIAQHEDELCVMMHAMRGENGADAEMNAEMKQNLRALLARMPAEEYADDLHAVEEALTTTARPEQAGARVPSAGGRKSTPRVEERKLKSRS